MWIWTVKSSLEIARSLQHVYMNSEIQSRDCKKLATCEYEQWNPVQRVQEACYMCIWTVKSSLEIARSLQHVNMNSEIQSRDCKMWIWTVKSSLGIARSLQHVYMNSEIQSGDCKKLATCEYEHWNPVLRVQEACYMCIWRVKSSLEIARSLLYVYMNSEIQSKDCKKLAICLYMKRDNPVYRLQKNLPICVYGQGHSSRETAKESLWTGTFKSRDCKRISQYVYTDSDNQVKKLQ